MMATSSPGSPLISHGSAADADSLRAAALRTLKLGKKRRPTFSKPQAVPLSRPGPQDIFQLDYGQDDNSSEVPSVSAPVPSPSTSALHVAPSAPTLHETDVDMREEGEISDEESPVAAANLSKPTLDQPDNVPLYVPLYVQADRQAVTSMSSLTGSPVPSLLNRISSPSSRSPTSSVHMAEGPYPILDIGHEPPTSTPPPYFLSVYPQESVPHENHYFPFEDLDRRDVRPGLNSKSSVPPVNPS